jgi:hypothetical protein
MFERSLSRGVQIARLQAFGVALVAAALVAPAARLTGTAVFAAQSPAAANTGSRSWIGQEAAVEESLRTMTIDRIEAVPVGVTKPKRAFFSPGAPIASAAWKPLKPGMSRGYWESYKSEIAAYELDKLLDMHMVPPTVEREIEGEKGAVILWLDRVKGWNMKEPVRGPQPEWTRQVSRMKLFDQLIANIDRNAGNLLYDDSWQLFLIDHSRAFTDRTNLKDTAPIQTVDQKLWDRINAVTRDDLDRVLGPWLDGRAIGAILKRRDLMRDEVGKRVAKLGEAGVFLR